MEPNINIKPDSVRIIQIVTMDNHVLGLGDNSVVYEWLADSQNWKVWGDN